MDAVVNLKMSPAEFDTMRKALEFFQSNQQSVATDRSTDIKLKNEARKDAYQASELLKKVA